MLVTGVLSLLLLVHQSLSAPQVAESQRVELADAPPPPTLANPFGSGEENRRLLQSYIKANLKEDQGGPEVNTWEQEVFFLFSLHDYDRSGHMDGLEMMKLLSDFNSQEAQGTQSTDQVVSMVDFLLQTQDLNQDGLLAPSELLSPPITHPDPKQAQEGDVAPDANLSELTEHKVEEEPKEEESNQGQNEQEQQTELHVPEGPAGTQEQGNLVPAHQGQPEM